MLNIKTLQKIAIVTALIPFLHGCAAVVVGSAATGMMVAQDRRTAGTIVEDKSIQIKTLQAIEEVAKGDPTVHVNALSYNNRVLLIGQAPNPQAKEAIEKAVRDIAKIKQIHNEIQIGEPTAIADKSTDTWITTKIKGEMAITQDLNPTRVKVTTEDGVVYLMGIVTPREEEITVDIARHTKGVRKVVKIFEYQNA